jgi:hypothetical protein
MEGSKRRPGPTADLPFFKLYGCDRTTFRCGRELCVQKFFSLSFKKVLTSAPVYDNILVAEGKRFRLWRKGGHQVSDYLYTTITVDGVTRYYETYLNPNGVWDSEGRVDYRVQMREISFEEYLLLSVVYGE